MTGTNQILKDFFHHLLSAAANASLYGPSHPQVERFSSQAYASISLVLEDSVEIALMIIDDELVVNGQAQELGLFLNRLARMLKSHRIGHIKMLRGITREELDALIEGLSRPANEADLEFRSTIHLRFGQVEVRLGSGKYSGIDGDESTEQEIKLSDLPREELARFKEIYDSIRRHKKLRITGINEIVSGFIEAFRQESKALLAIAALREADEYTFTHSTNVCILNMAQAKVLGIEGQLLKDIGVSAMLHDIGKLFIPEEILTKKGTLSDEEFELMKLHPTKGARYLLETPGVPRIAAVTAFEHHSRFNLSGYPKLPAGWRHNLCSHLTMISDFYDALRTRRSYREPMERDEISVMLESMMGTQLHPQLTVNFLNIISSIDSRLKADEI
jgi:HD-GYP domain-containing protein (c-di-GMP phosphodiesterase class II)